MKAVPVRVLHHMVCRHRVEVAVSPPRAELYFRDERWIDPVDTQLRFEATVFNADTGVTWQVVSPAGGPGAGTIDATGLYQAPDKGALDSGTTDIVVVAARADTLRRAFAWVTLVGLGPFPAPAPRIALRPKLATLFYAQGADNDYIDATNKLQVFRAFPEHAADPRVQWAVDGAVQAGNDPWFTYYAPNGGGLAEVSVTAALLADPTVHDDARIVLRNYAWPHF